MCGHGRAFGRPAKTADKDLDFSARSPANVAGPTEDGAEPDTASIVPEPPATSVDFPGLHDLDALVLPPAPLERVPSSEMDRSHASGHEHTPTFQDEDAAAPAESPPTARPVFDLQLSDRVAPVFEPEPLISSFAGASVSSSFQALADTVLMRDPEMIERLTREALRPMLKTWLDENLPSMVERLVRAEIERVARGGRSQS